MKRALDILESWDKMATVDNRALPIQSTVVEVVGANAPQGKKALLTRAEILADVKPTIILVR